MGNIIRKLNLCSTPTGDISRRHDITIILTKKPQDEDLGHSFCYIRPDPYPLSTSKPVSDHQNQNFSQKTTTFSCISGASVSANTSTPLSTSFIDVYMYTSFDKASAFQCSASFFSIPLQPVPFSGRIERGFCSGPIERIFESGPIDKGLYSGLIEKGCDQFQLQRSFSNREFGSKQSIKKQGILRKFKESIEKTLLKRHKSIDGSVKESNSGHGLERNYENNCLGSVNLSSELSLNCDDEFDHDYDDDGFLSKSQNLQWAQGKAGEDRVHIVISDENGWVFVGIYDGFNGPDAPDFLLSNLYSAVHNELKGLLRNNKLESKNKEFDQTQLRNSCLDQHNHVSLSELSMSDSESNQNESKNLDKKVAMKWDREKTEQFVTHTINHDDILKALSIALKKTEAAYLDIADKMLMENPELALMGSCVLAMLMKGEDVYLMNVGDSRAVLAQDPDQFQPFNRDDLCELPSLDTLQLTLDHSTSIKEEVHRIKKEHPDDTCAIMNDRVKGSLKVTRAFGAGYLKQPKWNNALLEMFRIDYIGSSPYLNCNPYLYHHKLGSRDRFLILSSDGLYQYFTNEEAVSQVESFMCSSPEGDPAQHLIEEVLFRAAKKASMEFHELLEIPQGDRRRFHDDVSIIIISLEGRIWRSSV